MRGTRRVLAILGVVGAVGLSAGAQATRIGDTVDGEVDFAGFPGTNFFDPANGQVPPPPASSGTQPSAVVIDPDPTFPEFAYTDGSLGWDIWITDLHGTDVPGTITGVDVVSSDSAGLSAPFTADSAPLSYAGGEDIEPFSITDPRSERIATIDILATHIPEPASGVLVAAGLLALVGLRRRAPDTG